MKKQSYKVELNKMIKDSGRKRVWLSDQMNMSRMEFWRAVQADSFSPAQKRQIEKLLTK